MFKSLVSTGIAALASVLIAAAAHADSAATIKQAAGEGKTVFLVFHRKWDAKAEAIGKAVKAGVEEHAARTTWVAIDVSDSTEKAIIDRFKVARAPIPLVLGVHPNGAVTGVFQKPMSKTEFAQALFSPSKADCIKGLQDEQLVLLCVHASDTPKIPQGVKNFQTDPHFAKRTRIVTVKLNDPNEADFFTYLEIQCDAKSDVTVFMVPPGVIVGKFAPSATKEQLSQALHKAGKCCDDENCKHNH